MYTDEKAKEKKTNEGQRGEWQVPSSRCDTAHGEQPAKAFMHRQQVLRGLFTLKCRGMCGGWGRRQYIGQVERGVEQRCTNRGLEGHFSFCMVDAEATWCITAQILSYEKADEPASANCAPLCLLSQMLGLQSNTHFYDPHASVSRHNRSAGMAKSGF